MWAYLHIKQQHNAKMSLYQEVHHLGYEQEERKE